MPSLLQMSFVNLYSVIRLIPVQCQVSEKVTILCNVWLRVSLTKHISKFFDQPMNLFPNVTFYQIFHDRAFTTGELCYICNRGCSFLLTPFGTGKCSTFCDQYFPQACLILRTFWIWILTEIHDVTANAVLRGKHYHKNRKLALTCRGQSFVLNPNWEIFDHPLLLPFYFALRLFINKSDDAYLI